MIGTGHRLDKIVESSLGLQQVRKEDLQFGDMVLITTRNSIYSIYVLDPDTGKLEDRGRDVLGLVESRFGDVTVVVYPDSDANVGIPGCGWAGH